MLLNLEAWGALLVVLAFGFGAVVFGLLFGLVGIRAGRWTWPGEALLGVVGGGVLFVGALYLLAPLTGPGSIEKRDRYEPKWRLTSPPKTKPRAWVLGPWSAKATEELRRLAAAAGGSSDTTERAARLRGVVDDIATRLQERDRWRICVNLQIVPNVEGIDWDIEHAARSFRDSLKEGEHGDLSELYSAWMLAEVSRRRNQ